MATIKLYLDIRKKVKNSNKYKLVIRVRHAGNRLDFPTLYAFTLEEFDQDKELVRKDKKTTATLLQLRNNVSSKFVQLLAEGKNFTEARAILLKKEVKMPTIKEFWMKQIQQMVKAGRAGGANVYLSSYKGMCSVVDTNMLLSKLSFKHLIDAETQLRSRNVNYNSIGVYMRTLRALCNQAINLDIVEESWYPFKKYTIKKEKTIPRNIGLTDMQKFFNADISKDSHLYKSFCIGKLIFLLRGINLKDLLMLTEQNIINGRIIYKRAKTKKLYSVNILPAASEIFEEFKIMGASLTLLGVIDSQYGNLHNNLTSIATYIQKRKVINEHLFEIGKRLNISQSLTTYVFRYTYANVAKQMGFSKDLIAEALGHSYGNNVTGIYLEMFDQVRLDEMHNEICKAFIPVKAHTL